MSEHESASLGAETTTLLLEKLASIEQYVLATARSVLEVQQASRSFEAQFCSLPSKLDESLALNHRLVAEMEAARLDQANAAKEQKTELEEVVDQVAKLAGGSADEAKLVRRVEEQIQLLRETGRKLSLERLAEAIGLKNRDQLYYVRSKSQQFSDALERYRREAVTIKKDQEDLFDGWVE